MKPIRFTAALLALVAAAAFANSAQAQVFNTGDILLGFDEGSSASDYEVDLGAFTQFKNATTPLTFQLSTADLTSAFGSGWASNTSGNAGVQFGLIGGGAAHGSTTVNGSSLAADTLFYTQGEVTPGVHQPAPAEHSSGTQGTIVSNLNNATTGSGGFTGGTLTGNGAYQAIIQSASATNSFDYEITTKVDFGIGSSIQQPDSGVATGPTDSVLDLFESDPVNGGTSTYLGDFSLSSTGLLTFFSVNVAAVPEPSTYALLGLGAMLLLWTVRRRNGFSL